MDLLVVVAAALSILPTPLAPIALPPATSSSCCSDNSVGITSFTSCFASFSISSIFLLSSLMVFLLFEKFSYVNSRGAVEASQINCLHPIRCKPTKNGTIIVSRCQPSIQEAHPIPFPVIAYVFGQVGSATCPRADQIKTC